MEFLNKIDVIKQRAAYKTAFILYALFFATEFSTYNSFTILKLLMIGWGCGLIVLDVYTNKNKILKKFNLMLNLFILMNIISLILFPSKAYNFRIFLITIIQIGVLNNSEITQTPRNVLKEINKVNFIFIIGSFVISAISLCMFVFKFNIFSIAYNEITRPDLLKGLFLISNIAGLVSLISIMVTVISIVSGIRGFRAFYWVNILVQGLVLYLTKARASWIGLIIFIIVYGFISIKNKTLRRSILIIILIGIVSLPVYGPKIINNLDNFANKTDYYQYYGFLSGRQMIWTQGYESIVTKNTFLGVGYKDVVDIIKNSTTQFLPGIDGGRMHNIYFEILCSHGILALIFMVMFFIANGVAIYKDIFKEDIPIENRRILKVIFAMFMSLYALGFVESVLVYVISVVSIIYWIYVGYSEYFIRKYKKY
ncbi:O-antigen ligase family protein [Clostridium frigidicarnis]|uniref:O-Antigen ligase n=1 Tax=Clostridium frigidicarnis TaxID=84698 RepID=A0A1I1B9S5_9CLOT|nr:O-antigen ligase family protein [Clostridium frigidicarnis]SFB45283.1 O-Antigen ligase [Clostridium frigidicarnis]